ncbi:hypothetical protein OQA88_3215 [Cercophora sp. LCS_1]
MSPNSKPRQKRPHPGDFMEDIDGAGRPRKQQAIISVATNEGDRASSATAASSPGQLQINWRSILCSALQLPQNVNDQQLEDDLLVSLGVRQPPPPPKPQPSFSIIHRVECSTGRTTRLFSDTPTLVSTDDADEVEHLSGRKEIQDLRRYADRLPGTCFLVIRDLRCCYGRGWPNRLGPHTVMEEYIYLVSDALRSTIVAFEQDVTGVGDLQHWSDITVFQELKNLQYWIFQHEEALPRFINDLAGEEKEVMAFFWSYIGDFKSPEYAEARRLHATGKTSARFLRYLLIPGAVFVVPDPSDDDLDRCMKLKAWPDVSVYTTASQRKLGPVGSHLAFNIGTSGPHWELKLSLDVLKYDAPEFRVKKHLTSLQWDRYSQEEVLITSLEVYPFKYAENARREKLASRGRMFWACRTVQHVQYDGFDAQRLRHFSAARFIVDHKSWGQVLEEKWKQRHRDAPTTARPPKEGEAFVQSELPSIENYACFPPVFYAFDLQGKRWQELAVGSDTKDVVKALVTHKVANTVSTDLIRGKGSGLILLFHGNALVSGIMILTSNRVGTFDEGFKSRIQLSIQYPKLTQPSRRKVWRNFFDRLENDPVAKEELDIEDLRGNELALSRFELNGREIRNAINVARPLAMSENRLVNFECLEKVIKVQRDFDKYLKEMNEGLGDDEVAREEGRR